MNTEISHWFDALTTALAELKQKDFGFPIGNNRILPAKPAVEVHRVIGEIGVEPDPSIVEFYTRCDGVSLPGVQNGYFVHSLDNLTARKPPHHVTGEFEADVVIVGSTGGGQLFALRKGQMNVLFLPHGLVNNGVYDGTSAPVRILADSFAELLDRLLVDVEAFLRSTRNHEFIA